MIRIGFSGISVERRFQVSPADAWDLLTDTEKWPLWGPSVKRVSCSDRHIRQGSTGRVLIPTGIRLPFVVTEYEHESFWTWKVAGITATGHRLIPSGQDGCKVAFEMPLHWIAYVGVCELALRRIGKIVAFQEGGS